MIFIYFLFYAKKSSDLIPSQKNDSDSSVHGFMKFRQCRLSTSETKNVKNIWWIHNNITPQKPRTLSRKDDIPKQNRPTDKSRLSVWKNKLLKRTVCSLKKNVPFKKERHVRNRKVRSFLKNRQLKKPICSLERMIRSFTNNQFFFEQSILF